VNPRPAEDPIIGGCEHGDAVRIGIVSDTHGYLDPTVADLLAGVDLIIHAGDIGDPAIVTELQVIAPAVAVSGNLDTGGLCELPTYATGEIQRLRFAVGHKRKRLAKRLASIGGQPPDLVVFGHDHIASLAWAEGSLWVNPGSASAPYEEDDTPSIAIVERVGQGLSVCFIPIDRR
jgi:uncharacterized protein